MMPSSMESPLKGEHSDYLPFSHSQLCSEGCFFVHARHLCHSASQMGGFSRSAEMRISYIEFLCCVVCMRETVDGHSDPQVRGMVNETRITNPTD